MSKEESSSKEELESILNGPPESTARLVWDLGCELGEGCIYDDEANAVLFTDIVGKKFHKLDLAKGEVKSYNLPKMLCAFCLLQKGEKKGYLCAWEDGFEIFDLEHNESLSPVSQGENVTPNGLPSRLNDGKLDRTGKYFICGGFYGGDVEERKVKVYRCSMGEDNMLVHTPILDDSIQVANSLCFSPDGATMYFTDSPSQTIVKFQYEDGEISNKETVAKRSIGLPDGSCVDAEGFIWNAVWRDGAGPSFVVRIHPRSGEEVYHVRVPDNTSQVSCCCFGGPDLDILFLTTAAHNRRAVEPNAGGLYAIKVPFKGLPESRFILKL
jgi:L-arabinonolactonase